MKLKEMNRTDLRKLPYRKWPETSIHDSLIMFPSGDLHDSGWGNMTIIGCTDFEPTHILTENSDDVSISGDFRVDCIPKSMAFHYWNNGFVFEVGASLSSISIRVYRK